ncbi:MAG: hypothetical protein AAGC93_22425 [Cyanobacteria bacterium P01_F01_bin.53]
MNSSTSIACGFLGGTIFSVDGGYQVLQHPKPARVFSRIADAKWFLAVNWCEQCDLPSGILTHEGQVSFFNAAVLDIGETAFLPMEHRKSIFKTCLTLSPGESAPYQISSNQSVEVLGVEVDPRYGKVAIVKTIGEDD